jgi:transposase
MTLDEILRFKEWVINNNCEAVAIESTGIYWVSIYTVLEGNVEVIRVPTRFVRKVSIRQKLYNYLRKYLFLGSLDITI